MCQQIVQFCTGSTKPLLFAGGALSLLLAIAIGYTACTTNALYNDIDPEIASTKSLGYLLQLAAAGYLTLITLFSCYAAYYDQKHSIRALAFISTLNFVLALAALMLIPSGREVSKLFEGTLKQALPKYDFTDKGNVEQRLNLDLSGQLERLSGSSSGNGGGSEPVALPVNATSRQVRWAADDSAAAGPKAPDASLPPPTPPAVRELNATSATQIWDRLQARGCCGMVNGTEEWKAPNVPKSCCSQPVLEGDKKLCKSIDLDHQQGCLTLIGSTGLNLLIVLGLIALVNFYLALIAGVSAYRTFHYDEASQGAYT